MLVAERNYPLISYAVLYLVMIESPNVWWSSVISNITLSIKLEKKVVFIQLKDLISVWNRCHAVLSCHVISLGTLQFRLSVGLNNACCRKGFIYQIISFAVLYLVIIDPLRVIWGWRGSVTLISSLKVLIKLKLIRFQCFLLDCFSAVGGKGFVVRGWCACVGVNINRECTI